MIPVKQSYTSQGLFPRGVHRAWVAEVYGRRAYLTILGHGELLVDLPDTIGVRGDEIDRWTEVEIAHVDVGNNVEAQIVRLGNLTV